MQVYYNLCLGLVHVNTLVVCREPKEILIFDSKGPFCQVQLHLILSKSFEATFQVPNMLFTSMLSRFTSIDLLISGVNILFINLWYVALVFVRPKGLTR